MLLLFTSFNGETNLNKHKCENYYYTDAKMFAVVSIHKYDIQSIIVFSTCIYQSLNKITTITNKVGNKLMLGTLD